MNREILFKAKPKNWRQQESENYWVEGYYAQLGTGDNIVHYICQNMAICKLFKKEEDNMYFTDVEIDPSTICQFTGLTDKNGKKIFENDICSTDIKRPYAFVVFRNGCFMYQLNDGEEKDYFDIMMPIEPLVTSDKYTEVIGNVFDNPELLEV